MATEIKMPQLSDTMDQGTILTWNVKAGDSVERGDALAEVSTDKADLEVESFHEGTVLKLCADVGQTVQVGEIIAYLGSPGESVPESTASVQPAAAVAPAETIEEAVLVSSIPEPTVVAPVSNGHSERVKISPLARNLAQSQGVDYTSISGSGEGGRIVKKDIEAAATQGPVVPPVSAPTQSIPQAPVTPAPTSGGDAFAQPLSKMRQTIATRMVEAATTVPHFYLTTKVHMDAAAHTRQSLKELPQYEGITYNHLVLKAAALALKKHPRINSAFRDNALLQPQDINIGIITALEDGLIIPILKYVDQLSLVDIVTEGRALVQRARSGRPKAEDLSGGTFSISNVGRFSVESFTAIINPGQGGILAVGAIDDEPIVVDGAVKSGKVMRVTLSVDHRIIDGVVAGQWLTEFKRVLEDPVLLLA